MTKIYCISGLGVDHRAFGNIAITNATLIHVPWIPPEKKESLVSYAKRLFDLHQPEKNAIYMGVSFGGMIAQEWASIQQPKELILISTTDHYRNIKAALRTPGKLGLNRLIHPKLAVIFSSVSYTLFGAKTKEDKAMLKAILRDTDSSFFRWASGALLQWKASGNLPAIRIHGTKDRIIRSPEKVDLSINSGHFAVFSEGSKISHFLENRIH
jgi:pimeloyl-ACP methyl ester carboxylesterase